MAYRQYFKRPEDATQYVSLKVGAQYLYVQVMLTEMSNSNHNLNNSDKLKLLQRVMFTSFNIVPFHPTNSHDNKSIL